MKLSHALTTLSSAALGLAMLASNTQAYDGEFVDVARVTHVLPVYETIERQVPSRECWVEQVREEIPVHHGRQRSATGTIVGGIIGGAIGNAVGAGSENKKVGAVVGSILGMSVGNDISRQHHRQHHGGYSQVNYQDVERCEVRYSTERDQQLVGYNVTYKYRGRTYTTQMDQDPGRQIKVAVDVRPLSY